MKLYSNNDSYELYNGNMLDMLEVIEKESIDSIVCDPPYGLTSITKRFGKEDSAECKYGNDGSFQRLSKGFMGKEWDGSGIEYNVDAWTKCYEVLKPGGYLLAFGGSRTYHRIACAIEDAGFEIRDTIMWLYGSGFPKSMNIGLAIDKKNGIESIDTGIKSPNARPNCDKTNTLYESGTVGKEFNIKKATNEWNGWGTALKPSFEPIIVARKPFKGSCVDNVIKYGVGGINIDECRVGNDEHTVNINDFSNQHGNQFGNGMVIPKLGEKTVVGRFPANTILTYDENDFEEVCGGFLNTKSGIAVRHNSGGKNFGGENKKPPMDDLGYNDSGSASRYFYCAKASKKDRDEGLEHLQDGLLRRMRPDKDDNKPTGLNKEGRFAPVVRKNTHPTVKPTTLMQYLVRLVTPNGGTILDPFNGSGSTGKAVMYENKERNANYKYIGIELTEEYLPIAKARIEYACNLQEEENQNKQLSIFDNI